MKKYNKGQRVLVSNNTKLYPTYDSKESSKTVSGHYFIYSEMVRDKRIRITDTEDKVGKPCSMTGWIDVNSIENLKEEEK